jgi:hypothetical protein
MKDVMDRHGWAHEPFFTLIKHKEPLKTVYLQTTNFIT